MAETAESPGSDEQYCRSCGAIINEDAELCPECGVRNATDGTSGTGRDASSAAGDTDYVLYGALSAGIGFFLFPIVFGPLAAYFGWKAYKRDESTAGLIVLVVGVIETLLVPVLILFLVVVLFGIGAGSAGTVAVLTSVVMGA